MYVGKTAIYYWQIENYREDRNEEEVLPIFPLRSWTEGPYVDPFGVNKSAVGGKSIEGGTATLEVLPIFRSFALRSAEEN